MIKYSPGFQTHDFQNKYFSLTLKGENNSLFITMRLHPDIKPTTENFPHTFYILKKNLPCILRSACFNDKNLPFKTEVKTTQIGHLFEHILLEYLANFKRLRGYKNARYCGLTQWDWDIDPVGVFHIKVDISITDDSIIYPALIKSVRLLNTIIDSGFPDKTTKTDSHKGYLFTQPAATAN